LAPPSGVMRQRTLSYRLISIHRRTLSYVSKNIRTLALRVFVPWAIKVGKNLENCTSPFLPENIPSPHQLTLDRAEGVAVDPLSL